MGDRGQVRQTLFLALVVDLALGPGPAQSCLQCDPNFADRFASYPPLLSRKSWGLGDVPAAGRQLRGWSQNTLQEMHLEIPTEIPFEDLRKIAEKIYEELDALFKGKTYKPGVLPERLHSIFEEQVSLLRDAIITSKVKCGHNCGLHWFEAISCETCNQTKAVCFGYSCESPEEWEKALEDLYAYLTKLPTTPKEMKAALEEMPVFSNCTATSLEKLNFDNINTTLSKNWLKAKAMNTSGEIALVELLTPVC